MKIEKKNISNIEKKLEIYDKIFEKIFHRFDVLDKELQGYKSNKRIKVKKSNNEEKIYLSIAGLSRVAGM